VNGVAVAAAVALSAAVVVVVHLVAAAVVEVGSDNFLAGSSLNVCQGSNGSCRSTVIGAANNRRGP
jgi:hypothetical protein